MYWCSPQCCKLIPERTPASQTPATTQTSDGMCQLHQYFPSPPVVSHFFRDIPVNLSKKIIEYSWWIQGKKTRLTYGQIQLVLEDGACPHHHTPVLTAPFITIPWHLHPLLSLYDAHSFIRVTATHSAAQATGMLHCHWLPPSSPMLPFMLRCRPLPLPHHPSVLICNFHVSIFPSIQLLFPLGSWIYYKEWKYMYRRMVQCI